MNVILGKARKPDSSPKEKKHGKKKSTLTKMDKIVLKNFQDANGDIDKNKLIKMATQTRNYVIEEIRRPFVDPEDMKQSIMFLWSDNQYNIDYQNLQHRIYRARLFEMARHHIAMLDIEEEMKKIYMKGYSSFDEQSRLWTLNYILTWHDYVWKRKEELCRAFSAFTGDPLFQPNTATMGLQFIIDMKNNINNITYRSVIDYVKEIGMEKIINAYQKGVEWNPQSNINLDDIEYPDTLIGNWARAFHGFTDKAAGQEIMDFSSLMLDYSGEAFLTKMKARFVNAWYASSSYFQRRYDSCIKPHEQEFHSLHDDQYVVNFFQNLSHLIVKDNGDEKERDDFDTDVIQVDKAFWKNPKTGDAVLDALIDDVKQYVFPRITSEGKTDATLDAPINGVEQSVFPRMITGQGEGKMEELVKEIITKIVNGDMQDTLDKIYAIQHSQNTQNDAYYFTGLIDTYLYKVTSLSPEFMYKNQELVSTSGVSRFLKIIFGLKSGISNNNDDKVSTLAGSDNPLVTSSIFLVFPHIMKTYMSYMHTDYQEWKYINPLGDITMYVNAKAMVSHANFLTSHERYLNATINVAPVIQKLGFTDINAMNLYPIINTMANEASGRETSLLLNEYAFMSMHPRQPTGWTGETKFMKGLRRFSLDSALCIMNTVATRRALGIPPGILAETGFTWKRLSEISGREPITVYKNGKPLLDLQTNQEVKVNPEGYLFSLDNTRNLLQRGLSLLVATPVRQLTNITLHGLKQAWSTRPGAYNARSIAGGAAVIAGLLFYMYYVYLPFFHLVTMMGMMNFSAVFQTSFLFNAMYPIVTDNIIYQILYHAPTVAGFVVKEVTSGFYTNLATGVYYIANALGMGAISTAVLATLGAIGLFFGLVGFYQFAKIPLGWVKGGVKGLADAAVTGAGYLTQPINYISTFSFDYIRTRGEEELTSLLKRIVILSDVSKMTVLEDWIYECALNYLDIEFAIPGVTHSEIRKRTSLRKIEKKVKKCLQHHEVFKKMIQLYGPLLSNIQQTNIDSFIYDKIIIFYRKAIPLMEILYKKYTDPGIMSFITQMKIDTSKIVPIYQSKNISLIIEQTKQSINNALTMYNFVKMETVPATLLEFAYHYKMSLQKSGVQLDSYNIALSDMNTASLLVILAFSASHSSGFDSDWDVKNVIEKYSHDHRILKDLIPCIKSAARDLEAIGRIKLTLNALLFRIQGEIIKNQCKVIVRNPEAGETFEEWKTKTLHVLDGLWNYFILEFAIEDLSPVWQDDIKEKAKQITDSKWLQKRIKGERGQKRKHDLVSMITLLYITPLF